MLGKNFTPRYFSMIGTSVAKSLADSSLMSNLKNCSNLQFTDPEVMGSFDNVEANRNCSFEFYQVKKQVKPEIHCLGTLANLQC